MSRPAKPSPERVGRELAAHGLVDTAHAEQAGKRLAEAWAAGEYAYRDVLAVLSQYPPRRNGDVQRGIALTAKRFGIQLT